MIKGSVLLIALLHLATPVAALTDTPATSSTPAAGKVLTEPAAAQTLANTLTQQLTTLLSTTGITAHLPDIHAMVQEARARHMLRCSAEAGSSRTTDPYNPQNLHHQIVTSLRKNISPSHLTTVLKWYDSDIGQRVAISEKRDRPTESFDSVLRQVKQSPGWSNRKSLITKVEQHTRANSLGATIGIETEHGGLMLSGCIETYSKHLERTPTPDNLNNASGKRTNREQLMAQIIRDEKPLLEMHHYLDTLDAMTFGLQDVGQHDLTDYAGFTASPAARHVFATLVSAIEHTLQSASLPKTVQTNQKLPEHQSPVTTQLEE